MLAEPLLRTTGNTEKPDLNVDIVKAGGSSPSVPTTKGPSLRRLAAGRCFFIALWRHRQGGRNVYKPCKPDVRSRGCERGAGNEPLLLLMDVFLEESRYCTVKFG